MAHLDSACAPRELETAAVDVDNNENAQSQVLAEHSDQAATQKRKAEEVARDANDGVSKQRVIHIRESQPSDTELSQADSNPLMSEIILIRTTVDRWETQFASMKGNQRAQEMRTLQGQVKALELRVRDLCRQNHTSAREKESLQNELKDITKDRDEIHARSQEVEERMIKLRNALNEFIHYGDREDLEIEGAFQRLHYSIEHWAMRFYGESPPVPELLDSLEASAANAFKKRLEEAGQYVAAKLPVPVWILMMWVTHGLISEFVLDTGMEALGLTKEESALVQDAQQSLSTMEPRREYHRMCWWRSELLRALSAREIAGARREEKSKQFTQQAMALLLPLLPASQDRKRAEEEFHRDIASAAFKLASLSMLPALRYRFDRPMIFEPVSGLYMKRYELIDLTTRCELRHDKAIELHSTSTVARVLLVLRPGLTRVFGPGEASDDNKHHMELFRPQLLVHFDIVQDQSNEPDAVRKREAERKILEEMRDEEAAIRRVAEQRRQGPWHLLKRKDGSSLDLL